MQIEDAILQVERLYQQVTGNQPPQNEKPYAPFLPEKDPAAQLSQRIDHLVGALQQNALGVPQRAPWIPPASMWQSEKELVIRVEVAGINKDEVEVEVRGDYLVITGQRHAFEKDGKHQLMSSDLPFGPFQRALPLFPGLKTNELAAKCTDGILEITIPRDSSQQGSHQSVAVG